MKSKKKSVIIAQTLSNKVGGPAKTVGFFKTALDAEVVSFNNLRHKTLSDYVDRRIDKVAGVYNPYKLIRLAAFLKDEASVVSIHSVFGFHFIFTSLVCIFFDIRFFVVPHGAFDEYTVQRSSLLKRLYLVFVGFVIKRNGGIVVATEYEKKQALNFFSEARVHTLFWPVANSREIDIIDKIINKTRNLKIDKDYLDLLYIGRLHPMKRLDRVVEYATKLSRDHRCRLHIVGNEDGVTERDIRRWVGMTDTLEVVYHGEVYGDEKWPILVASDLYISASERENFNHTAAEALLAGVPVVLSKGNGLQDIVVKNCVGFRLEQFELGQVLSLGSELSTECRRFAYENFSVSGFQEALRRVYFE
jgi:glycosyltransferase involved in cell wall biosynthesis